MLTDPKIAAKATVEKVLGLQWWTDKLLTFTTTRPPGYSFAAGQYARLGLRDANGLVWRAYSMVSSPGQEFLEFYGVLVPGGLFTSQLKALKEGDGILVEKQCFGFMTPDRFTDGEDLWMIATGTGVGPFISMLRDPYVWGRFRNLILVHGVRNADELSYRDELPEHTLRRDLASAGRFFRDARRGCRSPATEGTGDDLVRKRRAGTGRRTADHRGRIALHDVR